MNKDCRIGKNTIATSIKGSFQEIKLMRNGKMPERSMEDLYKNIAKWKSEATNVQSHSNKALRG